MRVTVSQPGQLLDILRKEGIAVSADCGGRGVCGKCRVKIIKGVFFDKSENDRPLPAGGTALACRTFCAAAGGCIEVSDDVVRESSKTTRKINRADVALDVGTTTLEAALVDAATGETAATHTSLNPQRGFGADVMSRISASADYLDEMRSALLLAVAGIIRDLKSAAEYDGAVRRLAVTGNTTMIHIFRGVSPAGLGTAPFTPVFLAEQHDAGSEYGLPVDEVIFPASASAFIGSDITTGVLSCGLAEHAEPVLFVDAGTNSEMVLFSGTAHGNQFMATSAAAGPALEGAGISCGTGGIPGAISTVSGVNGALSFETIGHQPPRGICGSGLVDLIAVLLDAKIIDTTGFLKDAPYPISKADALFLTQKDVRAFQLAKAAISAGIETLVEASGLHPSELSQIVVAGGLGSRIREKSALRTGLFPPAFADKTVCAGNTALNGAVACLAGNGFLDRVAATAASCRILNLNDSAAFPQKFMREMSFRLN